MTGPFDPADMPRIEHAVVDEETQMQRYLAEIAMEDIALSSGARKDRPDGLMAQYKRSIALDGDYVGRMDNSMDAGEVSADSAYDKTVREFAAASVARDAAAAPPSDLEMDIGRSAGWIAEE